MPCVPLPAIEGWSLSNNAEADWESMDDWVASAAKEDVDSWYLRESVSGALVGLIRVQTRLSLATYNLNASLLKQSWSLISSKACFLNEALTQCKTSYT